MEQLNDNKRYTELANKIDGIDENKKPFVLSLLKGFVKWEAIEAELAGTELFKKTKYKGQEVMQELPSFKMLSTATARKEDAIKSIVKLLSGDGEDDDKLTELLNDFNKKHTVEKVEIR